MKELPPKREERATSGGRPKDRLLYGINPITEAMAAGRRVFDATVLRGNHGPELKKLVHALRQAGAKIAESDRHNLAQMVDSRNHQGVVARVDALDNGSLTGLVADHPEGPLTVLLVDHLQDPQNLGAIYRSAEAFGVNLIFLPAHDSVSHQLGSVAKSSAGAVEHVPTVVVRDLTTPLRELKEKGFRVVGLSSPDAREPLAGGAELADALASGRLAIALGAEGPGLSKPVKAACDEMVTIATAGKLGSLNAATACGIVLHERWKHVAKA